jgi:hypothetical protein
MWSYMTKGTKFVMGSYMTPGTSLLLSQAAGLNAYPYGKNEQYFEILKIIVNGTLFL